MNKENIPVITDREELYDKCENMEQLFDKYYLPLLDKHYSKIYKLQQELTNLKAIEKEHQRINGELREENKRLYKSLEELSQYKHDREEEDMMNYLIEQEEVFNDYSFMEE